MILVFGAGKTPQKPPDVDVFFFKKAGVSETGKSSWTNKEGFCGIKLPSQNQLPYRVKRFADYPPPSPKYEMVNERFCTETVFLQSAMKTVFKYSNIFEKRL